MCNVIDPLAGSYYIETLTDQIEEEAWEIFNKIEDMGGAVVAIEKGFMQQEVAKSAYKRQKRFENCEQLRVGSNCFTGEHEMEVLPSRLVEHPYSPEERETAEEKQIANLREIRKERDNQKVESTLKTLRDAAQDKDANLIPSILEAVKAYATIGEMCGVLREVFGEHTEAAI